MKSQNKPTIRPMQNGPYVVEGLSKLQDRKGSVEAKPKMALCRCGGSSNKPFCDGTHAKIGFSSAKLEDRVPDTRDTYAGAELTIHDNRSICAHAGRCTDGLPKVFKLGEEPWIDPTAASASEIRQVIHSCPSGALAYSASAGEEPDRVAEPSIFVAPNGPYVVSGAPELLDSEWGEGASKARFTLCRCGASKNKPFCDGTHWNKKFDEDAG